MSIKSIGVSFSGIIVMIVGILVSMNLGYWETESTKIPAIITSGEYEGESNPEDIRGSYSFGDIENAFQINSALLADAFNIQSETPSDFLIKDLEGIYEDSDAVNNSGFEIGTGAVKLFVSLYTGLPYVSETDGLPESAVKVLKEEGKWDDAMAVALEGKIIPVDIVKVDTVADEIISDSDEEEHEEEIGIKGQTTFQDVIDWGISKEAIESIMGITVDNVNMVIRDLCIAQGIDFGTVKEALNEQLLQ